MRSPESTLICINDLCLPQCEFSRWSKQGMVSSSDFPFDPNLWTMNDTLLLRPHWAFFPDSRSWFSVEFGQTTLNTLLATREFLPNRHLEYKTRNPTMRLGRSRYHIVREFCPAPASHFSLNAQSQVATSYPDFHSESHLRFLPIHPGYGLWLFGQLNPTVTSFRPLKSPSTPIAEVADTTLLTSPILAHFSSWFTKMPKNAPFWPRRYLVLSSAAFYMFSCVPIHKQICPGLTSTDPAELRSRTHVLLKTNEREWLASNPPNRSSHWSRKSLGCIVPQP